MINIRKLENELWESADLLRSGSKLTSNQYCMPVLGLIFLRYAYSGDHEEPSFARRSGAACRGE